MIKKIFTVVFFFVSALGFGQQVELYTNSSLGFELKRPSEWYFEEFPNYVNIFTSKEAYKADAAAAGLTIAFYELMPEDGNEVVKFSERFASRTGFSFKHNQAYQRKIGGLDWYTVPFASAEDRTEGEFSFRKKGGVVIIIAYFFKNGILPAYKQKIERIITSFKFLPETYLKYKDEEIGISFEYPANSVLHNEKYNVVLLKDKLTLNYEIPGSGIILACARPDSFGEEIPDDAKLALAIIDKIKVENDDTKEIKVTMQPKAVKYLGQVWQQFEFTYRSQGEGSNKTKFRYFIRQQANMIFIIIYIVSPLELESSYNAFFQRFSNSLKIDYAKWAAYVKALDEGEEYGEE